MGNMERYLMINAIAAIGVAAAIVVVFLPRRISLGVLFTALPLGGFALGQLFC